MTKQIKILSEAYDLSDEIADEGTISESIDSYGVNQLALQKVFRVRDPLGEYSLFSSNGAFYKNQWRNAEVVEIDDDGQTKFNGVIKSFSHELEESGSFLLITAIERAGLYLDQQVEEIDDTSYTDFTVNGNKAIGTQTVTVSGTGQIETPCRVYFNNDIFPSYQVSSASGTPNTSSIVLDRGLEQALTNGDTLNVSCHLHKTFPEAIKESLIDIGLTSYIGDSFDILHASDTAAGYGVVLFIPPERGNTLRNHIIKLLEMSFSFLQKDEDGMIQIFRGLAWDQVNAAEKITGNEIFSKAALDPDVSNLLNHYECLYLSGSSVRKAEGDFLTPYTAAVKNFHPIIGTGKLAIDYEYLYNSSTTAAYFGSLTMDFFAVPRFSLVCPLRAFYSTNPNQKVDIKLGKKFRLSFRLDNGYEFEDEPGIVIGYNKNLQNEMYSQVKISLHNFLLPGYARELATLFAPEIVEVKRSGFDLFVHTMATASPNILRYIFEVANNPEFTDADEFFIYGGDKVAGGKFYLYLKKILSKKYIRCRAIDTSGDYSFWSNTWITDSYNYFDLLQKEDGSYLLMENNKFIGIEA